MATNGYGIVALGTGGSAAKRYNIHNNQIYRNGKTITSYIRFPSSGTQVYGNCTNNFFDSPTVDGSSQSTISGLLNQVQIDKNINQTIDFNATVAVGIWATGNVSEVVFGDGYIINNSETSGIAIVTSSTYYPIIKYDVSIAGEDRYPVWMIQLSDIIPWGAHVISVEAELSTNTTFTTANFTLSLIGSGLSTLTQDGGAPTPITTSGQTLTITTPNKSYIINNTIMPIIKLSGELNIAASGGLLNILSLTIKYRW